MPAGLVAALVAGLVTAGFSARPASGQCEGWLPGDGVPGVAHSQAQSVVTATQVWDPDGAGPREPVLVVGGLFDLAGDRLANNIAMYDPVSHEWSNLGEGVNGQVTDMAVLMTGELVVVGPFTSAGGGVANRVAVWDGAAWSTLGSGFSGSTEEVIVLRNGDVVVTGDFNPGDGSPAKRIARWDGTAWSGLGTGLNRAVTAVAELSNGDIVVGGDFTQAGGVAAQGIARWDGDAWSALPGVNSRISTIFPLENGEFLAGGSLTQAGGQTVNHVARWDGAQWQPLGSGMNRGVFEFAQLPNGDILATGYFTTAGGTAAGSVARWDGQAWSPVGSGVAIGGFALSILPDGRVVAGAVGRPHVYVWDGETWGTVGPPGFRSEVYAMAVLPDGRLAVGGPHAQAWDPSLQSSIAVSDSSSWVPLGPGLGSIFAMTVSDDGDLYVGGHFLSQFGQPVPLLNHVARFSGGGWAPLGEGVTGVGVVPMVYALAFGPSGRLIVGGSFDQPTNWPAGVPLPSRGLVEWDGVEWSGFGQRDISVGSFLGFDSQVHSIAISEDGQLVVGGELGRFSFQGIGRWNGTYWERLGLGLDSSTYPWGVYAMRYLQDGNLIAAGRFDEADGEPANSIAAWDGQAWSPLGQGLGGMVLGMTELANGSIVVGGAISTAGGHPVRQVARWDGTAWHPLGSGVNGAVRTMVELPNGELAIAGNFTEAGGQVSAFFARYSFTGIATMSRHPQPQSLAPGQTLTLSATPSNGYSGLSVQWYRDGVAIAGGPGGASAGGGVVSGAAGVMPSPTKGSAAVLTITGAQASDSGVYHAEFSNTCGSVESEGAAVSVVPACAADVTGDGQVDSGDLQVFIVAFLAGDTGTADLTGDGQVDSGDLQVFIEVFVAGC